jgi:hypothetical protein
VLLACVPVLVLAGCRGPGMSATDPAPGLTLGPLQPGEGLLSAEVAYAPEPLIARYVQFAGASDRPERLGSEVRVRAEPDGWTLERVRLVQDGREPRLERRLRLVRGADGSVLLLDSSGGDESATTRFDPPMPLAGAAMRPGETIEADFRVNVSEDGGPRQQSGLGSVQVRYAGRQRVQTPMGVFDAELLLTTLRLEFGPVVVRRSQRQWFATVRPGRSAMVAEDVIESQSVFGIGRSKTRTRLAISSIER